MSTLRSLFQALPAIAAVGTLPAGILAAIFVGLQAAAVVFVVGWLLVMPLSAVINEEVLGEPAAAGGETVEETDAAERDPIEQLRERYAAGEIDEVEFERRLEDLVATEDVEVPPGVDVDEGEVDGDRAETTADDSVTERDLEYESEHERS